MHRATVNRYIADLPPYICIDDQNRLVIDKSANIVNLQLNLHECLAVHLASRLLATRMDRWNPHAASALRKLGFALEKYTCPVSRHILQAAATMDAEQQKNDPVYLRALEVLTLGWANGTKVTIWHRSKSSNTIKEHLVSPYFIEPYAIGQTTQLICFCEPEQEMRNFKIERIERAERRPEVAQPLAARAQAERGDRRLLLEVHAVEARVRLGELGKLARGLPVEGAAVHQHAADRDAVPAEEIGRAHV